MIHENRLYDEIRVGDTASIKRVCAANDLLKRFASRLRDRFEGPSRRNRFMFLGSEKARGTDEAARHAVHRPLLGVASDPSGKRDGPLCPVEMPQLNDRAVSPPETGKRDSAAGEVAYAQ